MKPQRRFTPSKRIGDTLAEAQLSTLNGPGTATALGATAGSGFKQVGHGARIIRLQHEASPIRLYAGVDAARVALEPVRAEPTQRVTHLTYAVRERQLSRPQRSPAEVNSAVRSSTL